MPIPADKTDDYEYYRKICKERFEPATSINERRLQFRSEKQTANETFDAYYEKLLTAAAKAFPNASDTKGCAKLGKVTQQQKTSPKQPRQCLAVEAEHRDVLNNSANEGIRYRRHEHLITNPSVSGEGSLTLWQPPVGHCL